MSVTDGPAGPTVRLMRGSAGWGRPQQTRRRAAPCVHTVFFNSSWRLNDKTNSHHAITEDGVFVRFELSLETEMNDTCSYSALLLYHQPPPPPLYYLHMSVLSSVSNHVYCLLVFTQNHISYNKQSSGCISSFILSWCFFVVACSTDIDSFMRSSNSCSGCHFCFIPFPIYSLLCLCSVAE